MLAEEFTKYFELEFVSNARKQMESFKIRYDVYCKELNWEPLNNTELESDEYDKYSYYCLLKHKASGTYAGTIRLIIPPVNEPRKSLAIESHGLESIKDKNMWPDKCEIGTYSEISRLAVTEQFRRRPGEKNTSFSFKDIDPFSEEERRNFPNIAMGLYLGGIAVASLCRHERMYVMVEPRLKKRLERFGLPFQQIGDEIEFRGARAIFYLPSEDFTRHLPPQVLSLYEIIKQGIEKQMRLIPYVNYQFS